MGKGAKKIVVKIGSSVIAPKGKLDSSLVLQLVKDILLVEKKGYKVILVSSGAIACGLNQLKLKKRPKSIHTLMAISSLGQIILMDMFNNKFKKYKRNCAQILLTWDDFDIRQRYINISKTIVELLAINIIPIINENDVVSHEEIGIGDNDRLSAKVSDLIGAQQLIILSDIEGLLDGKRLVKEVARIDNNIRALVKKQ
ncbi:MAG: glutamate 5-kinase, partial [Candidatus Omnitrophica bacterium]|nr:glutamate 5-kinase [Candidatus Omnitrophota bacterium]